MKKIFKFVVHFIIVIGLFLAMMTTLAIAIWQLYLKDIAKEAGHGWYAIAAAGGFIISYILWEIAMEAD